MMLRKKKNSYLAILLALAILFAFSSCGKLKVSKLKSNYHFSKANQFYRDNKVRNAIAEYEAALKENPNLTEAYRFLGESYKNLYKPGGDSALNKEFAEKALQALKKAYEIEPANKDIIYSLGDMYDKMRNFEEAEKLYLRIIELEPTNMNNYYVVAEFYKRYVAEREELKAKAEDMYLRRIETDPENPQGYAYVASYYDGILPIPEFDKANEFNKKRLELDPKSVEIYYTIGVNRFSKAYRLQNTLSEEERMKLADESEKALLKAIELDPVYPEPYSYMKILYININAKLYPEKEERYKAEADKYGEKFTEARKKQLDRIRLEKELKKTA
jgi:tetratricopeptide (TPR) repeat protein